MLAQIGGFFRKLSFVVIGVGLLVVFYTEAFADVPLGKFNQPKPPMWRQRLDYCLLIGAGVPGAVWGVMRVARGKQPRPWE